MEKIFDASSHQPSINWDAVQRAGYLGASIKVTGGNQYINDEYRTQIAGARSVGMVLGHYHYDGEPTVSTGTADEEAAHFLAHADVQPGEWVALDAEERGTRDVGRYARWLELVEQAHGCAPLLYTFESFVTELGWKAWQPLARYPLWFARYWSPEAPAPWPAAPKPWDRVTLWQWSGGRIIPGIIQATDDDLFDGTREELVALGKPGALVVAPPFQHAEGFMGPPLVDTMNWGGDTAGIVTKRVTEVYNDELDRYFRLTWTPEGGITVEAID